MESRILDFVRRGIWLIAAIVLCLAGTARAETDVTTKVQVVKGALSYDLAKKQSFLNVSVKNISTDVLLTPVKVVVTSVTPATVTVANADGVTADGKPYYNYTTATGQLLPGGSIAAKRWNFANPSAVRFSYTTKVLASAIIEVINGITVPPAPDAITNKASIAGVDSNGNGLRDDVERFIAQEFGSNIEFYAEVKVFSTTLQASIINPTPATTSAHLDFFRCIGDIQKLKDIDKATMATLDTPERQAAYGDAFAGAVITEEGCQP